jgi:hypothetical protein
MPDQAPQSPRWRKPASVVFGIVLLIAVLGWLISWYKKSPPGQNRPGKDSAQMTSLPQEWSKRIVLAPGRSRIIDPESETCGGEYVDRNVDIIAEEGCIETTIDSTPYAECAGQNTTAPSGEDYVVRNRSTKMAAFTVTIITTKKCS